MRTLAFSLVALANVGCGGEPDVIAIQVVSDAERRKRCSRRRAGNGPAR